MKNKFPECVPPVSDEDIKILNIGSKKYDGLVDNKELSKILTSYKLDPTISQSLIDTYDDNKDRMLNKSELEKAIKNESKSGGGSVPTTIQPSEGSRGFFTEDVAKKYNILNDYIDFGKGEYKSNDSSSIYDNEDGCLKMYREDSQHAFDVYQFTLKKKDGAKFEDVLRGDSNVSLEDTGYLDGGDFCGDGRCELVMPPTKTDGSYGLVDNNKSSMGGGSDQTTIQPSEGSRGFFNVDVQDQFESRYEIDDYIDQKDMVIGSDASIKCDNEDGCLKLHLTSDSIPEEYRGVYQLNLKNLQSH